MGQLRKRGNVWWLRYFRNGKRYEESSGSDKKGVARDLLRLREGDIAKGMPVSSRMNRYRFADAIADIKAEYRAKARRSLPELERRIKLHLDPWFGNRRMSDITTSDVLAFTDSRLEKKASHGEINRELSVLKRMFSLAVKHNRLMYKPHIPMLAEDNVRKGFVDRDQFETIRTKLPEHLRAVVTFAYLTGWRIQSEILGLEWRQVDLKAGTVCLDPGSTKNREGRTICFADNNELRLLFEELWKTHER